MDKKTYDIALRFSVNDENPEVLEIIKQTLINYVKENMTEELSKKDLVYSNGVWDKKC